RGIFDAQRRECDGQRHVVLSTKGNEPFQHREVFKKISLIANALERRCDCSWICWLCRGPWHDRVDGGGRDYTAEIGVAFLGRFSGLIGQELLDRAPPRLELNCNKIAPPESQCAFAGHRRGPRILKDTVRKRPFTKKVEVKQQENRPQARASNTSIAQ